MYYLLDTEPRSDVMQTHQIEQAFHVKKCSSKMESILNSVEVGHHQHVILMEQQRD
jgi:hypothetical protein